MGDHHVFEAEAALKMFMILIQKLGIGNDWYLAQHYRHNRDRFVRMYGEDLGKR
jgi:hypothetical protein